MTSVHPAVTVVIPCYNRSDLLGRALASVLAQRGVDFEVIVGDDASEEDLSAVIRATGDPRVRLVRRAVNGGIGAARNVAVGEARAPLLAFLDSDDEWLPGQLAAQVSTLTSNPQASACTTWYEMRYSSGRCEIRRPRPSEDLLERVVRRPDLSAGSTMAIRASAWWAVGPWREDIRRYEDYEWFLRFAMGGHQLVICPHVGARIHSNDLAALDIDVSGRSIERIIELHGQSVAARSPGALRALRATFSQEMAWAAWRSGDRLTCARHVGRALLLDPVTRVEVLGRAAGARLRWRARRRPVAR